MSGSPLVVLMKDRNLEVRQAAALSLWAIAPETRELAPVLVELTQDEDIFISSAALSALRKTNPILASRIGLE